VRIAAAAMSVSSIPLCDIETTLVATNVTPTTAWVVETTLAQARPVPRSPTQPRLTFENADRYSRFFNAAPASLATLRSGSG
jgi:hypothetical protein